MFPYWYVIPFRFASFIRIATHFEKLSLVPVTILELRTLVLIVRLKLSLIVRPDWSDIRYSSGALCQEPSAISRFYLVAFSYFVGEPLSTNFTAWCPVNNCSSLAAAPLHALFVDVRQALLFSTWAFLIFPLRSTNLSSVSPGDSIKLATVG